MFNKTKLKIKEQIEKRKEKTLQEKMRSVENKIKKREKLTTEDLLVIQAKKEDV